MASLLQQLTTFWLLCCLAGYAAQVSGQDTDADLLSRVPARGLLQSTAAAPAPAPALSISLQAGPGDILIPGAVQLQVTCPFVVPFNQASQVLITNALQSVLPPNSTIGNVTLMRQVSSDTVMVNTQFSVWESQLPILLANKCCALEVLYLQHAVESISPSAVGQNVSMQLIDWTIGQTSMRHAPAGAPTAVPGLAPISGPGPLSPGQGSGQSPVGPSQTAPGQNESQGSGQLPAQGPMPGPGQGPMPGPGQLPPPLPSGQARFIDLTTPFFVGGVTADSSFPQAQANYTVVDVPVRTISASNQSLTPSLQLAIAHRYAVKAIMWNMGVQVEMLNMTASSNVSMISSVDFHNRLWVSNEEPSYQAFVTSMLRVASAAPTQYAQLMNQSGFNVQVDVLNTSVVGTVANSSLPSIEVMPPSNSSTAAYSSLLMSLEVDCPDLLPFSRRHRLALTAAATQVLQQYGAMFVSIQSFNNTGSAGSRKLSRKLLSHHDSVLTHQGRHMSQAASSDGPLQVNMLVTSPTNSQLQVLSPGTSNKTLQALTAAGYPGTITLTGASLDVASGPFGTSTNNTLPVTSIAASPSTGGGLSHSKKDAAIAVPVIVGVLLAALVAGLAMFLTRRRRQRGAKPGPALKPALGEGGYTSARALKGAGIMDTAKLTTTGATDSPARTLSGTDLYDTDPDGSMALSPSPVRPLPDAGVDMQATQAGAVRRVLGRMHAREQEVSNALAETSTFVIHHLQAGAIFRKKYCLTGWRWRSPSAIWCGADQVEEPWSPVVLKMYALTSDFIREKELLDMPYSLEHCPQVFDTYTYTDVGFEGDACPPCIVMQPPVAGLQTWMDAQDPVNPVWEEQVATLYNLCKALQSYHARGMVHCSLAPGSFSWFQGGQGWKMSACGDWAQAGMHVRSCYHLRYAPPEAVQGDLFDVAGAAADPAMDMWALGVIAFEIFTSASLFSDQTYSDIDVVNMLLGFEDLPSESQPAFWHKIKDTAAQRLVQNLLRRLPEQRSTINEVLASPIFNVFTQTKHGQRGRGKSLWSQDFMHKLTTTASSLKSFDTRMCDEQPSRPSLDAQNRDTLHTNSIESIKSQDLKDTTSLQDTSSLRSIGAMDNTSLRSIGAMDTRSLRSIGNMDTRSLRSIGAMDTTSLRSAGPLETMSLRSGPVETTPLRSTGPVETTS